MIFLKIGVRNVFRNKRRSFITASALAVSLAAMIISDGFMEGMVENMIKTTTNGILGHAQIHNQKFIVNRKPEYVIQNYQRLVRILENDTSVKSWTSRVQAMGMVASPRNAKNVTIFGIDSKREKATTGLNRYLKEGKFIDKDTSIVIGKGLKKKLGVQIDDKIILTTTKILTGELSQEVFRISGIISFGARSIDSGMVFVTQTKLQKMLNVGKQVHEIVLNMGDPLKIPPESDAIWKKLGDKGNIARNWQTLVPSLSSTIEMSGISTLIMGSIMGILMALIITNTLFMAIFERLFEFGVVRALGTETKHLILTILVESMTIGILSLIGGIFLALGIGGYLSIVGIDYGGIEFNGVTFREPIYFVFRWHQWVVFPLITVVFTMIVGLYPAIFTSRLNIGNLLRKSL
ncbi:ABC transporter permease [Bacteriovoracaceae bacterium]|nr:ABC transporter permease [Bacteriovoracaceae bacterium]